MDKKKISAILLAGGMFVFSMQAETSAATAPQLKPKVRIESAGNYKPAVGSAVQQQTKRQPQKNTNIPTKTNSVSSTKTVKTETKTTAKEPKIYKDSEGNPISEQQKERSKNLKKTYKKVTKDEHIMEALELLKGGLGEFSRRAILGNNLSEKPMQVNFEDLSKFGQAYMNFDALGWKKKDRLYIYINKKHQDAPRPALAAILAHEALHQDDFNSLNEETYAWTMEAAVWTQLSEKHPEYNNSMHPLVVRENTLKKLFIKGNYTSKYIRKTVFANPGYSNLPSRSPGFEDDNL